MQEEIQLIPIVTNEPSSVKTIPLNFLKECQAYRVVEEFSSAKYKLSNLELKIWLVFLSELVQYENSAEKVYTFDPTHIADLLHMDTHQARTSIIVDACKSLAQKYIEIINPIPSGKRRNHDWITFPLFSAVAYDSTNDLLHIKFNHDLHKLLFNFAKQAESILIDLKNVISVKRVNAMRALIVIKDMDDRGINSIEVDEFKKLIAENDKYPKFAEFKRRVLSPIEKDICSHTEYNSFSFSYNGKRGVKTSAITFTLRNDQQEKEHRELQKAEILESFRDKISVSTFNKLATFSYETLDKISLAIFAGFQMEFLSRLPLEDEEVIAKNIDTAINYIHHHLNKSGSRFSNEEAGRIIFSAIIKNQANVPKKATVEPVSHNIYDNPDQYHAALEAAAKKYLKDMSNNEFMQFFFNNKDYIENTTHCKIQYENILKRDARKADYKKLVLYVIVLHQKRRINLFQNVLS